MNYQRPYCGLTDSMVECGMPPTPLEDALWFRLRRNSLSLGYGVSLRLGEYHLALVVSSLVPLSLVRVSSARLYVLDSIASLSVSLRRVSPTCPNCQDCQGLNSDMHLSVRAIQFSLAEVRGGKSPPGAQLNPRRVSPRKYPLGLKPPRS